MRVLLTDGVYAKIKEGTHVLMPVKADGEMMQAIEAWFSSRLRYRNGHNNSAMNAECWNALMAYGAMVELFKGKM